MELMTIVHCLEEFWPQYCLSYGLAYVFIALLKQMQGTQWNIHSLQLECLLHTVAFAGFNAMAMPR